MAKLIALVSLLGLTAGAPASFQADSGVSTDNVVRQEAVISQVMTTLQPAIDQAIAKALASFSFNGVATQENLGPVSFSGSVGNTNYEGNYGSSGAAFSAEGQSHNSAFSQTGSYGSAQYGVTTTTANNQQASAGLLASQQAALQQHHNVALQQQQQSLSALQQQQQLQAVTSNNNNNNNNAKYATVSATSVSSVNQQQLVESVLSALVPSVQAAVQAALANQQVTTTTTSFAGAPVSAVSQQQQQQSSSFSSNQQSVGTFSQTATTSGQSQQVNIDVAQEAALVRQIIEVLTPSITSSVRKALISRLQVTQVQNVVPAVATTTITSSNNNNNYGVSSGSLSASQFNTQSSSSSSASSGVDSNRLVAQIITQLKPSIALSVSDALSAQAAAFAAAQQQQQTASQQSSFSSSSSSSSSGSSGSLSSLFGDGGVHNVKVETPEYKVEYSNGK